MISNQEKWNNIKVAIKNIADTSLTTIEKKKFRNVWSVRKIVKLLDEKQTHKNNNARIRQQKYCRLRNQIKTRKSKKERVGTNFRLIK